MSEKWLPIESAPKDGTRVRYKREVAGRPLFHGVTAWRENVQMPPAYGACGEIIAPATIITGWMHPDRPKRTPDPTHWMSFPPPPGSET